MFVLLKIFDYCLFQLICEFVPFQKDALSFKDNPNLKIVWYEDLTTNFERQVKELAEFTGYEMTDENMKVIILYR